ncbi:MAG TPA: hypothetical protein VHH73_05115, partial [Verrucomicrobiae bacterium]|nr:hypothetical protein [Verrucomicrobiae bacterium]
IDETISAYDDKLPAPKFQYHSSAQLLIVIGAPQAIEVAGKVISSLPGQQPNPWGRGFGTFGGYSGGGAAYGYSTGGGQGNAFFSTTPDPVAVPGTPLPAASAEAPSAPHGGGGGSVGGTRAVSPTPKP